jgi:hypothetical protein
LDPRDIAHEIKLLALEALLAHFTDVLTSWAKTPAVTTTMICTH